MARRYGVPSHHYARPLYYGLDDSEHGIDLRIDLSSRNALRLKSGELDLALLSPIDYARNSSEYLILPEICVRSNGRSHTVLLYFREGLNRIKTVAADIGLTSELILTKIILTEKYDTNPEFIPMVPDVGAMLEKADGALVIGEPSSVASSRGERVLDLAEEWHDLTELPCIHSIWVGRRGSILPSDFSILKKSLKEGLRHLAEIAASLAQERQGEPREYESYLRSLHFQLDDEAIESLAEFHRFAFYYGIIGEVPDIHVFPGTGLDVSLN
jgi:chorismate dehydratase